MTTCSSSEMQGPTASLQWFDEFETTTVRQPVQLTHCSSTGARLSSTDQNLRQGDNENIMENLEIEEIPILWSEGLQINIPDEILSGNEQATGVVPSSPVTPQFQGNNTEILSSKAKRSVRPKSKTTTKIQLPSGSVLTLSMNPKSATIKDIKK